MCACVCATGGTALETLIVAVTKASPPHHICRHPFPESVCGREAMKGGRSGGLKEKKRKEGKGREEKGQGG